MALPAMAKQMNMMQKNIGNLTQYMTGKKSKGPDSYFKDANFRENAYESQFNKKPTQVNTNGTKKEEGGGFLSSILGFFKGGIGSIIDTLIGALVKGGLIAGFLVALGKYFREDEFRNSVNTLLDGIFQGIFGEKYKENILTGTTILLGAIIGWKTMMIGFEVFMRQLMARLASSSGLPGGAGGAPGAEMPDKNKKLPPRDPKTGRFMKVQPPSGGKMGGGKAGILGAILALSGAEALYDYNDERLWAITSDFEKTPYFDKITDEEMEQFLEFMKKKEYSKASQYYKGLGPKYGYTQKSKGGISGALGAYEWVKVTPNSENNLTPSSSPTATSTTVSSGTATVTSPIGLRNDPHTGETKMHTGVDVVGASKAGGDPIFATMDGTAKKGTDKSRGNHIEIIDGSGRASKYYHMSRFEPSMGAYVKKGDIIGYTGNTGHSKGAHLHYEEYQNGKNITTETQAKLALNPNTPEQNGQKPNINGPVVTAASQADARRLDNAIASATDKPLFSNEDLAAITAGLSSPFQSIQAGLKDVVSVSKATPYERDFYKNLVGTTAL
jgi:murein DD-endopeptidase MepM/ murein hydrolase activator NlpD